MNRKDVRYPNDLRSTEDPDPELVGLDLSPDPELLGVLAATQAKLADELERHPLISAAELRAADRAARVVERKLKAEGKRLCAWCYEPFPRTRKDRRFCSTSCRVMAYQDRRASRS